MRNCKEILAEKIKSGENVALYCYGIQASYILAFLERFYGVLPAVVIDNDLRKKGITENGIPIMPFSEASLCFRNLLYFICSDDFKYTIIGDLLEKGIQANQIINYVPVEKRRGCLYFYNRLLLTQGRKDSAHIISHCNMDSFKPQIVVTQIPGKDEDFSDTKELLDQAFFNFEGNAFEMCKSCVMNKEQYLVSQKYQKHYKSVAFYQETCADCLSHCVYCCVGGNSSVSVQMRSLESYGNFVDSVLALDQLDDDFTCSIDMSEREYNAKIALAIEKINRAGLSPLVWKINSCLLGYSRCLAELLQHGMAYVIWSLDAGTRETYRKIKQIDAFDHVVQNVRKYIAQDAFHGRFIVAKYLIVKGINNNIAEFDAFLKLVMDLKLQFVSLSFDFNVKADVSDTAFIQNCYSKIMEAGLQLTYKNNSAAVAAALDMNSILSQ